jgi:single-strand DNA-binding protein
MASMAVVCLTGNIGKDAEVQATASGKTVIKFSLAVKTGYGENVKTTWWNASYWRDQTGIVEYLKKGALIGITGEPSLREYSVDSGKRQSLDVRVSEIILLGSKRDAAPADDADDSPPPF